MDDAVERRKQAKAALRAEIAETMRPYWQTMGHDGRPTADDIADVLIAALAAVAHFTPRGRVDYGRK